MAGTILLIILIILVIGLVVLYFLGKKAQKKQEAQQEQMEAAKQTISMLIIDKKRLPIKQSGLPQMVIDQTPKLMRLFQIADCKGENRTKDYDFSCRRVYYDLIPVKKEVKADVSGIYIIGVRGLRGALTPPAKKKGWFARMKDKAVNMSKGK